MKKKNIVEENIVTLEEIEKFKGKKIIKINNINPYDYFDELFKKFDPTHSRQSRFITKFETLDILYFNEYPFKKEELNISIEFEGNETLNINYKFSNWSEYARNTSPEFKKFFFEERKKRKENYLKIVLKILC